MDSMAHTNGKDADSDTKEYLARNNTNQSINMTMEVFEKLYLTPENRIKGDFRKRFANPTPLPLLGFLIASTPLGCALMGWRGAGGGGAATIGTYYFFGGLLQIIGSLLEWFIGNTFPFIVFGSFGAFWLAFGVTLTPFYNAEGAFTATATTATEKAAGLASFEASLGFFLAFMGVLVFIYLICSLRTNVVFFLVFLFLDIAFFLLTAAYWKGAEGDAAAMETLTIAAGACVFVFCIFGWYLLVVQCLQSVDFPFDLPVGDLSHLVPSGTSRRQRRQVESV